MTDGKRKDIKSTINQIKHQKIEITKEFPYKGNFIKNNYSKCWVTCIFIDICGYTNFCDLNDDKTIAKSIRTFYEGILKIMSEYGIKNVEIQGDTIYGIAHANTQNHNNNQKIFNCAMDVKGYLKHFWKVKNFKIGIESSEELMIVVGEESNRKIVFAGGAVNEVKKLLEISDKENVILLGNTFVSNNKEILWSHTENKNYYSVSDRNIKYSDYYFDEWEK